MKRFNRFKALYSKIYKIKLIEDDLQMMYSEIYAHAALFESELNTDILVNYDVYSLVNIVKQNYSFKSVFYAYSILCVIAELKKDYKNLGLYAQEAVDYISEQLHPQKRFEINFLRRIFISRIKLKDYSNAIEVIEAMGNKTPSKSIPWYSMKMHHAILCIHQKDYSNALDIIIQLKSNPFIDSIPENSKEYVYLLYAYLAFLSKASIIYHDEFEKKQFRLYRTINNIPLYSKDKRGANISILIIQILFSIINRKYDSVIDQKDALKQYSYRYLKNDDSFRSNVFIRMIIEMTKAGFHPVRTRAYTDKLLLKLKSKPLEMAEQPLELEIIPYETLWEIILGILEKNVLIRRGRPKKT